MKLTTPLILAATALAAHGATQVTLQNFSGSVIGYPIVDNTGTPVAVADTIWQVGTFDAGFAATLDTLELDQDAAVLAAFTPTGSDGSLSRPGLFNNSISDTDSTGALGAASTPLYAVVTYTPAAGPAQALVFNFGSTFPMQDGAGAANVDFGRVIDINDVVFGNKTLVPADTSVFPAPLQKDEFSRGITFDAIPEPSTGLLAGLAGLALLARRRR